MDENEDLVRLGTNIRNGRLLLDITQEDLAFAAGVPLSSVRRLERGVGNVQTKHLLSVLRVLGTLGAMFDATNPVLSDLGQARIHTFARKRVRR